MLKRFFVVDKTKEYFLAKIQDLDVNYPIFLLIAHALNSLEAICGGSIGSNF